MVLLFLKESALLLILFQLILITTAGVVDKVNMGKLTLNL